MGEPVCLAKGLQLTQMSGISGTLWAPFMSFCRPHYEEAHEVVSQSCAFHIKVN